LFQQWTHTTWRVSTMNSYHVKSFNNELITREEFQQWIHTTWIVSAMISYHVKSFNNELIPREEFQQWTHTTWRVSTMNSYHVNSFSNDLIPREEFQQWTHTTWRVSTVNSYHVKSFNSELIPREEFQQWSYTTWRVSTMNSYHVKSKFQWLQIDVANTRIGVQVPRSHPLLDTLELCRMIWKVRRRIVKIQKVLSVNNIPKVAGSLSHDIHTSLNTFNFWTDHVLSQRFIKMKSNHALRNNVDCDSESHIHCIYHVACFES
jgi:hypothetical protein